MKVMILPTCEGRYCLRCQVLLAPDFIPCTLRKCGLDILNPDLDMSVNYLNCCSGPEHVIKLLILRVYTVLVSLGSGQKRPLRFVGSIPTTATNTVAEQRSFLI